MQEIHNKIVQWKEMCALKNHLIKIIFYDGCHYISNRIAKSHFLDLFSKPSY